jgi:methyl-accepting chemotaxis protein
MDKGKPAHTYEYSTEEYNYPNMEWFRVGKEATTPIVYSAPYYDDIVNYPPLKWQACVNA